DLLKTGQFEDQMIPAIINDFKKTLKTRLESNVSRAATMRSAFIDYEDWEHVVREISRMEKLSKADVVRVAKTYFGTNYVAGYRMDGQHTVPFIEKPKIDPISIDPSRESAFLKKVMALPVRPIEPVFVEAGRDYQVV